MPAFTTRNSVKGNPEMIVFHSSRDKTSKSPQIFYSEFFETIDAVSGGGHFMVGTVIPTAKLEPTRPVPAPARMRRRQHAPAPPIRARHGSRHRGME
jgi:hypothetical protein